MVCLCVISTPCNEATPLIRTLWLVPRVVGSLRRKPSLSFSQEFEYWLKRNPKILDSLLSFKTRKDECTMGSLLMSPSEQQLSGASPKLSSWRRGSKESPMRKDSHESLRERDNRGAFFKIGSGGSLASGGKLAGRQDSLLSQQSGGMDSPSCSIGRLQQWGGLNDSGQLQSITMGTQDSLLTQQSGQETGLEGELAMQLEEEEEGYEDGSGEGRRESSETTSSAGAQVSLPMDALEEERETVDGRQLDPPLVSFTLEEQEESGDAEVVAEPVQQVGLELEPQGDYSGQQKGLVPNTSVLVNLEAMGSESDPLAEGQLEEEGQHSIMLADSALSIDIAAVPPIRSQDQFGPDSPVLPTQQVEVVVGRAGGGALLVGSREEQEEDEMSGFGCVANTLGVEPAGGVAASEMGVEPANEGGMSMAIGVELVDVKPLTKEGGESSIYTYIHT